MGSGHSVSSRTELYGRGVSPSAKQAAAALEGAYKERFRSGTACRASEEHYRSLGSVAAPTQGSELWRGIVDSGHSDLGLSLCDVRANVYAFPKL